MGGRAPLLIWDALREAVKDEHRAASPLFFSSRNEKHGMMNDVLSRQGAGVGQHGNSQVDT